MRKEHFRKKFIKKAKKEVALAYTGKDTHIIKAVNLIEDLDDMFNRLVEQIREWYSVHFPELNKAINDNDAYLKLLSLGDKSNFTEIKIAKIFESKEKGTEIARKAKCSMGAKIDAVDLNQILGLGKNAADLKKEREELSKYIEKEMKLLVPNFSALAGALIGAKLLSKAGSVKKLALMPSSTIQVLGAEKALFQHMKKGAKSPKYGVLFAHPLVKEVPYNLKGKVARRLAGKLSIAVKEDFFGDKKLDKNLQTDLDNRMKALKKQK